MNSHKDYGMGFISYYFGLIANHYVTQLVDLGELLVNKKSVLQRLGDEVGGTTQWIPLQI